MDSVTGLWAQLLARAGFAVNSEVALVAALAVTVIVVAVALALGRRGSRLEARFGDREILQSNVRSTEAAAALPPDSDPGALSKIDAVTQYVEESNPTNSDPSADAA